ncbi:MAG: hypothetical protein ACE5G1_03090 [bacterium]
MDRLNIEMRIKSMDKEKVVYSISTEDAQTVAEQQFGRKLTEEEIKFLEGRIGNYIDWHDAIHFALSD